MAGRPEVHDCSACGRPIEPRSFRAYGPFEPRRCPHCGAGRWTETYAKKAAASRAVLGAIFGLAAAVAGTIALTSMLDAFG